MVISDTFPTNAAEREQATNDIAFALNEHLQFVGPRKYQDHSDRNSWINPTLSANATSLVSQSSTLRSDDLWTGKPGYFAIAVSQELNRRIVGWSGPESSAEGATSQAIAHCKQNGGTDPRIKAHWADGMPGKKE
jgi:hypothetical protein